MSRLSVRLCTIMCAVGLLAACSEPPRKEIDQAQQAVDTARQAGAEQYAPEAFAAATSALQQAREAVDQRDYRLALSRAVDASERAQDAARAAADNKARARSQAEAAINATNAQVMHLQARLKVADEVRVSPRELSPARGTLKDAALVSTAPQTGALCEPRMCRSIARAARAASCRPRKASSVSTDTSHSVSVWRTG